MNPHEYLLFNNFTHPGKIISFLLESRKITVLQASRELRIHPSCLYRIINGVRGIGPKTANALSKLFNIRTGDFWLNAQKDYYRSKIS